MSISANIFREVLSHWASGVTVVTSRAGERVQGMTVSAFCSVSLEPPLILVCAARDTITHSLIQSSKAFCVSLLGEDQQELSNRFASKKHEHRRFAGLQCEDGRSGCPRIPGAIAWLDCRVSQEIEAGDHVVYIGDVIDAAASSDAPLVYFKGSYRRLT